MNPKTQKAQHTRRLIARTFVELRDERIDACDILRSTPRHLRRMRVFDVLRRLPHMGGDGASKTLRKAKVWPVKRLGTLTPEEREAIIANLPPRVKS